MSDDNIIIESGAISLSDEQWSVARRRAEIISSIAEYDSVSTVMAEEAASRLNLSVRTIYRLIRRWRESGGSVPSLVSNGSNGGKGNARLSCNVEILISQAISDTYLSKQKPSVAALMRRIKELCHNANLNYPAVNTVRSRIKKFQSDEVLSLREGSNAARKLQPIKGQFPETSVIFRRRCQ